MTICILPPYFILPQGEANDLHRPLVRLPQGQSRLPREEDGIQMIKAVQLDGTAECVVEVPLADVELSRTSTGTESVLPR